MEQPLTCAEQALVLACAHQVEVGTSRDELQPWQMAPYVDAVLSQPKSCYAVRAAARLYR